VDATVDPVDWTSTHHEPLGTVNSGFVEHGYNVVPGVDDPGGTNGGAGFVELGSVMDKV
jgi:hypothetical protein